MNKLLCALGLMALSLTSLEQLQAGADVKVLSSQEAAYCKIMKRNGTNIAGAFISNLPDGCLDYITATDSIAREYFDQLEGVEAEDYAQNCLSQGFLSGTLSIIENSLRECSAKLSDSSAAGYLLGYGACYLKSGKANLQVLSLTRASFDPSQYDPEKFLVRPEIDPDWIAKVSASTRQGFKVGCWIGEKDRVLNRSPAIISGTDVSVSEAFALGQSLGTKLSAGVCQNFTLRQTEVESLIPETDRAEFINGLRKGAGDACLQL